MPYEGGGYRWSSVYGEILDAGTARPDGTVYAGISPDTGKAMYATPQDATHFFGLSRMFNFEGAQKYAAKLDANGHKDWRVPTKSELNVLFQNRAAIGGFNETGSYPDGWYWSSLPDDCNGWAQRFGDGNQDNLGRYGGFSLRCVR